MTFPWRISDVFVWDFTYGVSRRMCQVRVTYVWRMKCTRDISTACVSTFYPYLRHICSVSIAFNKYENKRLCSLCSCNLHITVTNYQRSKMPPEKSRLTPKKKTQGGGGGRRGCISKLPILVVRRHEQRQRLHQA